MRCEMEVREMRVGRWREMGDGGWGMGNGRYEMEVREMSFGEMEVRNMGVREMGVREMGVREMGVREMGVREMEVREMGVREMEVGETAGDGGWGMGKGDVKW